MRNRNTFIVLSAIAFGLVLLLATQTKPSQSAAAQSTATVEGTTVDISAACEALRTVAKVTSTPAPDQATEAPAEIARPSNPGGPGAAVKLVGDPKSGEKIYVDNCQKCHGDQGQGGIKNPGSDDGTIPEVNPIDETLVDNDAMVYACNLDVFVEHGSVPSGPSPVQTMPAWGDEHKLTSQQIADVVSYVINLNGGPLVTPAATPAP